jgi:probable addiction module antidote protein
MDQSTVDKEHEYFLSTPDGFSQYLSEIFKSDDRDRAIQATASAVLWKGLSDIAKAAGVTRVSLYTGYVTEGEPSLRNFMAVLDALGVQLAAVPRSPGNAEAKKKKRSRKKTKSKKASVSS